MADSPAASHAKRLFETAHALTDSGRAYNSVARELGLDWRTVRKYATACSWQECVRRRAAPDPALLPPALLPPAVLPPAARSPRGTVATPGDQPKSRGRA